jgi:hypothetical protein
MIALSSSDRSLWMSPAIALVLMACGVEAGAEAPAPVAPALAERAYMTTPSGDVGANARSTPVPVHRYGFDGQGTVLRDSMGSADGSVVAAQLTGDGLLRLPGGAAYVELPGGLLSQQESATLEFWLAWEGDSSRHDERIFHFGNDTAEASGASIDSAFFLSPAYEDTKPRVRFRDQSGAESQLFSWRVFPERRTTHVVVVLDAANHSMAFHIDGESLGSIPWNQTLAELRDDNVWLGRSQQRPDVNLSATFDEFRIYDRALTTEQIEQNFTNGPDGIAPSDTPAQAAAPQASPQ